MGTPSLIHFFTNELGKNSQYDIMYYILIVIKYYHYEHLIIHTFKKLLLLKLLSVKKIVGKFYNQTSA